MPLDSQPIDDAARSGGAGTPRPQGGIFYGWWIVLAVFVMLTVSSGLGFYNLSVLLAALTSERGFSVSAVSATTALCFVVSGVSGLGIARWIQRSDPRWSIAASAVLCAVGILMLTRAEALAAIYVAYAVFGVGFAGTSMVTGTTLVTRWFHRRRGFAIAIASTGLSLGGVLITPFVARLIAARGIEAAGGWLAAGYVLGVVPITLLLLRSRPASVGLHPDGAAVAAVETPRAGSRTRLGELMRSRFFVSVTLAFSFAMVAQVGALTHYFKLVTERAGTGVATTAVSVVAACSILGRLTGGLFLHRLPLRAFAMAMLTIQGLALCGLAVSYDTPGLLGSSAAFGASMGNILMLQSLLMAQEYGVAEYPRVFAIGNLLAVTGIAGGPLLLGVLYEQMGGYEGPFLVAAGASALAITAMRFMPEPAPVR